MVRNELAAVLEELVAIREAKAQLELKRKLDLVADVAPIVGFGGIASSLLAQYYAYFSRVIEERQVARHLKQLQRSLVLQQLRFVFEEVKTWIRSLKVGKEVPGNAGLYIWKSRIGFSTRGSFL